MPTMIPKQPSTRSTSVFLYGFVDTIVLAVAGQLYSTEKSNHTQIDCSNVCLTLILNLALLRHFL